MGVVVRRTGGGGPPKLPVQAIAKVMAAVAPGLIVKRTSAGFDVEDTPFEKYSKGYAQARMRSGRQGAPVHLWLTGGMLGSVRAVEVRFTPDRTSVTIAPGTGSSPRVRFVTKTSRKSKRAARSSASPAWNIVGSYLHYGTATIPPRPWLGLSPKDEASMWRQVADAVPGIRVGRR